jgi:hypothetical protein
MLVKGVHMHPKGTFVHLCMKLRGDDLAWLQLRLDYLSVAPVSIIFYTFHHYIILKQLEYIKVLIDGRITTRSLRGTPMSKNTKNDFEQVAKRDCAM